MKTVVMVTLLSIAPGYVEAPEYLITKKAESVAMVPKQSERTLTVNPVTISGKAAGRNLKQMVLRKAAEGDRDNR